MSVIESQFAAFEEQVALLQLAIDKAMARLMDMRVLDFRARDPDTLHAFAQAQTIAGDAWRILDAARKQK